MIRVADSHQAESRLRAAEHALSNLRFNSRLVFCTFRKLARKQYCALQRGKECLVTLNGEVDPLGTRMIAKMSLTPCLCTQSHGLVVHANRKRQGEHMSAPTHPVSPAAQSTAAARRRFLRSRMGPNVPTSSFPPDGGLAQGSGRSAPCQASRGGSWIRRGKNTSPSRKGGM